MSYIILSLAFSMQDMRPEALAYCKRVENTYQTRMLCANYMLNCVREIETNNVIYSRKDNITACKANWEIR